MPTIQKTAHTSQDVADWLNGLDRTGAVPVLATIGRTTYVGASYVQTRDISPGCRAYRDGERTYRQSGYYLLGRLPASYVRKSSTLYDVGSVMGTFYVAGYFGQDGATNEYHPFGSMFQLFRADRAMDCDDSYDRRPMIVRAV